MPGDDVRSFRDELDPEFRDRQWKVQRAGWFVMLAVIVLTILGVFGTSPFATKLVIAKQGSAPSTRSRWTTGRSASP